MKMINELYIITALSNMHVGSGDVNFGVIDNLIQRDTLSNYPNINSSGLKGAIREFFTFYCKEEKARKEEIIEYIFGSSPDSKNNLKQGNFRFFEANMLSIPVRSDKAAYLMATSKNVVRELKSKIEVFNVPVAERVKLLEALDTLLHLEVKKSAPVVFNPLYQGALIEDTEFKAVGKELATGQLELLEKIFGTPIVLLHDEDFGEVCSNDYLPVISRNNLEDGRSNNLWYEQVLPRATRLFFVLMKEQVHGEMLDAFFKKELLQVGGNASIGYGFTQVQSFTDLLK